MEYPPETGWGGIGSYVKVVAPALASRGHEVHVLSCVRGQRCSDYLDGTVSIHRRGQIRLWGLGRLLIAPKAASRLSTAISCWLAYRKLQTAFDVIEIPDWMGEGLLLAMFGSSPLVAHLHTPIRILAKYGETSPGWDILLSDLLERAAVRRAQVVTSPSRLISSKLQNDRWVRGGTAIVRNPIDYSQWGEIPAPQSTGPVVLFVGRLDRLKGPEILLRASATLRKTVPGLTVVFVGRADGTQDGLPYLDWLKKKANDLGVECQFVGTVHRGDLRAWYARARLLVVPSLYDNFPMVALEGMASARPVVCTSSTGIAEMIEGTGCGEVVPPGDPEALAEAMQRYLTDASLAAVAGSVARDLVRKHCAPERIAEEREAYYLEAISRWRHSMRSSVHNNAPPILPS